MPVKTAAAKATGKASTKSSATKASSAKTATTRKAAAAKSVARAPAKKHPAPSKAKAAGKHAAATSSRASSKAASARARVGVKSTAKSSKAVAGKSKASPKTAAKTAAKAKAATKSTKVKATTKSARPSAAKAPAAKAKVTKKATKTTTAAAPVRAAKSNTVQKVQKAAKAPVKVATRAQAKPVAPAAKTPEVRAVSPAPKAKPALETLAPTSGTGSSTSSAETRRAAAAFVAARQKMAPAVPPAPKVNKSIDSGKGVVEVADKKVRKAIDEQQAVKATVEPVKTETPAPVAAAPRPAVVPARPPMGPIKAAVKPGPKGQTFKTGEFIVYPSHGVGQITAIEQQEVAGYKLELFVISFIKDKMILKVPLPKITSVGMRKLAEAPVLKRALDTLTGRARIKRTMWSRRAQEYEAKINSGDLIAIAEVVRDLYRSDAQPEQSYSERQLYEAALDRMAREIAAVQKLTDTEALKLIDDQLQKGPRRGKVEETDADEGDDLAESEGGIGEAA